MFVLYNKTSKKYLYDTSICWDFFKYNFKIFKVLKRQNTLQLVIFSDIHNKTLKYFKLSCFTYFHNQDKGLLYVKLFDLYYSINCSF